jgi:hypothetical protein
MFRPTRLLAVGLAAGLGSPLLAGTFVQEGSLSGFGGEVEHFEIPLTQFDTQQGAFRLDSVQLDFVTGFSGGGTTSGDGGQPTRIDVELSADYSLGSEVLAETLAEINLKVRHTGPPSPFSFFDSDQAHVTLTGEDLAPWIGAGEVVMSAEVLFTVEENPPGSANVGVGGSVSYTVTYEFSEADVVVEDFESLTNPYGWSWGTGNETIFAVNGNPDAFLADLSLFSAHPILFTAPGVPTPFTGDYRSRGVTNVGVDLITLDTDFGIGFRPLTLLLTNDRGTPGDYDDDLWAWFVGAKEIPQPGVPEVGGGTPAGWATFDFEIPSASTTVPAGWEIFEMPGMTPDEVWNGVITDVDTVEFWYGVPGTIFPFLSWDVGADNVRIAASPPPPALPGDLNGDGVLDAQDVMILVQQFGPCDGCPADLNRDGVVDVTDLLTLLKYINGHAGMGGSQLPGV